MNPVSLRQLKFSDSYEMSQVLDNPKIFKNVRDRLPQPYTEKDAQSFIKLVSYQDPLTTFAIEYNGQLCGVIGLEAQDDVHRKSVEVGYWIGEPFWGRGIATMAVQEMIRFGFKHLDINRIFASTYAYNPASMRVLEKNGFVKEGIARKAVFKNGAFCDEHLYALLREDYLVKTTA
jgi:ribosomal-protein-alanine N-acetyltransferase